LTAQGATNGECGVSCTGDADCSFTGTGTGACIWQTQDGTQWCGVMCATSPARGCPTGYTAKDETSGSSTVCVCEVQ
jgi:hypothetical protein